MSFWAQRRISLFGATFAEHFLRFAGQQAAQERTPNEPAALREGEVAEAQHDFDRAGLLFSTAQRLFTELGSPGAACSADALARLGRTAEAGKAS